MRRFGDRFAWMGVVAMVALGSLCGTGSAAAQGHGLGNGSDGAYTSDGTTINTFSTVTSVSGRMLRGVSPAILPDDLVLVWQTRGAIGGDGDTVTLAAGAGRYVVARVLARVSSTVTLDQDVPSTFRPEGLQVVRIPEYTDVTISRELPAEPYNGMTGGVVVFFASGTVDLRGSVRATGGFRGGAPSCDGCAVGAMGATRGACMCGTDFRLGGGPCHRAGVQGEGLTFGTPTFSSFNFDIGGGGGGSINAGGAGGGNAGKGGNGGNAWCSGGIVGGFPGRPLGSGHTLDQYFTLGGGGGGGHQNDGRGTAGGNGGGVIFIRAASITGSGRLIASGNDARSSTLDGQGGGGAGGSVLVQSVGAISAFQIFATGGRGGSTATEGNGGGGGGGRVRVDRGSGRTGGADVSAGADGSGHSFPDPSRFGPLDGTVATGRPFGCTSDAGCSAPEGWCHPVSRHCTSCRRFFPGMGCDLRTEVCDDVSGLCVECVDNRTCRMASAPRCEMNVCSACVADADCELMGAREFCASGSCVFCRDNVDCEGDRPACNGDGECVGCVTNMDCSGATPVCDGATCRACAFDAECSPEAPFCGGGGCVECRTNSDCSAGAPTCDLEAGRCTGCRADADCPGRCDAVSEVCVECLVVSDCVGDLDGAACLDSGMCGCTSSAECESGECAVGGSCVRDLDRDGVLDGADVDDDGDGVLDIEESTAGFDPSADADGDGAPNDRDPDFAGFADLDDNLIDDRVDADANGVPNHRQLDSDADGVPDDVEGHDVDGDGAADSSPIGADADGDGLDDGYLMTSPPDHDSDGLADFVDPDDDGDAIATLAEVTHEMALGGDVDGDGIPAYLDLDSDADGLSDAEDGIGDRDGDGAPAYLDADDHLGAPADAGTDAGDAGAADVGGRDGGVPDSGMGADDDGCGCRAARTGDATSLFLLGFVLLLVRRRR